MRDRHFAAEEASASRRTGFLPDPSTGIGINFPRMNKIGIQSVNTRLRCLNLMHELTEQNRGPISNRFKKIVLLEARSWKRFQGTLVLFAELEGKSPVLQMVTPL